ncbi:MAG: amino-acid N-acetyltransferase [Gammaproteobacteria bacterium]|jgi:amino-acid N-acetyltransferase|nr:amino-acid N-acetyltransferase [Gammaproteobacteria bacterium]HUV23793.1 amino-acid N-acetyltransferase [Gammaproteobacteria bacterium]
MGNTQDYVEWFRGAAPYIKAHRRKTFVVMVSDEVIYSDRFIGLVHDIALLKHLGIKLVILHGSRSSIDSHLANNNLQSSFHRNIRITDSVTLPYIVQAINAVRTHFEAQLSMGLPNTPMSGSEITLASGNFVTGMPLGVIDGVDMQHSGKVRFIKHEAINALLELNHIVLLSNLGYSRTGEVFNLPTEELAAEVAGALRADKLIYLHPGAQESEQQGITLSTADCELLLQQSDIADERKNLLCQAIQAIRAEVKRVHFIDQQVDGGLLLELFTRNGYGVMITNLFYEGSRAASIDDIGGIVSLIEPLEQSGILVTRTREQLELQIRHFQVIEKDGMIIACIACIPDPDDKIAEIACLAVHQDYQRAGLASQLLAIAEERARKTDIKQLYTLTTRTSHWFIEHGFRQDHQFELPSARRANYNPERGSKILLKSL